MLTLSDQIPMFGQTEPQQLGFALAPPAEQTALDFSSAVAAAVAIISAPETEPATEQTEPATEQARQAASAPETELDAILAVSMTESRPVAAQTVLLAAALIIAGNNDRKQFDPVKLAELAASIAKSGLLQPPTVRPLGNGMYQIVCGERRYRACAYVLGWPEIPVMIKEMSDKEASIAMLVENTRRQDLNVIEEAEGYQQRIDLFQMSPAEIAAETGVSVGVVQRRIKLLGLREDLQELVKTGNLLVSYAEVLINCGLDSNFQMLAFNLLKENPKPSLAWLKQVCGGLLTKQSQATLFDAPLFADMAQATQEEIRAAVAAPAPPHPATCKPKLPRGQNPRAVLTALVSFWSRAAGDWDGRADLRHNDRKAAECRAAAAAIAQLLS